MSPHPNLVKDHVAEGVASHYPRWVGILTSIGTLSTTYSLSPGLQLSSQQKIPDKALDFSV